MTDTPTEETKTSTAFTNILAILSIIGFASIISSSLLSINIDQYIETLWLTILGLGFIIESSPIQLFKTIRSQLGERNFTATTTLTIGLLAVIAGILSIPGLTKVIPWVQIIILAPSFPAIKGIISIIAIIFIIIQTWVLK
jgi:hypothetical protein